MDWSAAVAYGAMGGAIVEAVVFYGRISTWQAVRHRVLARGRGRLPSLRRYIDLPSDLLAAVTRLLLGAGAGWLFHSQITGVYAAVAVGASAPALLRQLGAAKSVRGSADDATATGSRRGRAAVGDIAAGNERTATPGAAFGSGGVNEQWGEGSG
ncbi:hypothetical protein [Streptomyces sp. NPDC003077]|uniref:hypothetical protein n=1 Tax=Streptomyces sp. NPDC003077 TaxID=3154443 RepID=UPI0033AE3815